MYFELGNEMKSAGCLKTEINYRKYDFEKNGFKNTLESAGCVRFIKKFQMYVIMTHKLTYTDLP